MPDQTPDPEPNVLLVGTRTILCADLTPARVKLRVREATTAPTGSRMKVLFVAPDLKAALAPEMRLEMN